MGYGFPEINGYPKGHPNFLYDTFVLDEKDAGTLQLSGTFPPGDGDSFPASTALFLYIDNPDAPNDFVRGQGEIDPLTGNWTATVSNIPLKLSKVVLSFVVGDPADVPDDNEGADAYTLDVLNIGCGNSLTITLETESNGGDLDLYVTEPGGTTVWYRNECGVSVENTSCGRT